MDISISIHIDPSETKEAVELIKAFKAMETAGGTIQGVTHE